MTAASIRSSDSVSKIRTSGIPSVVDTISEYCPGLKESILHRQVLTPLDIEEQTGLTEGNSGTTTTNSYGYSVSLTGTTATVTWNHVDR